MRDLTKTTVQELKREIFDSVNQISPDHIQTDETTQYHIYHSLKIIKTRDGEYSVLDISRDKPVEITNKFLLEVVKEHAEFEAFTAVKEDIVVEEETAMIDMLVEGEVSREFVEEAEQILKENALIEKEETL